MLITTPITVALGSASCGGATEPDETLDDGNGQGGTTGTGTGGSTQTGSGGAGASTGSGGAGASGGSGAAGGSGATGSGGSGASGGTAGSGSGGTGSGGGGSGGGAGCSGAPKDCFSTATVILPLECVSSPDVAPTPAECASLCPTTDFPSTTGSCAIQTSDATTVTISCNPTCFVGRRPANLASLAPAEAELGAYFAGVAALEAASVFAFRHLRDELREHRAPKRLLAALGRAERDEIRHARSTRALARRFGKSVSEPRVARTKTRSLEAIALENVREGCVRETFGALLAHHHAMHAREPQVRATMQRIARDETRHAAASWAIQRWLESKLDRAARARVRAARSAALRELSLELEQPAPADPDGLAGFPSPATARALLESVAPELWS